jgi:arginine decarboxylase
MNSNPLGGINTTPVGQAQRIDPLAWVPRRAFFTRGVGHHEDRLHSFELALRQAGLAPFNLVTVSSILPPGCDVVEREMGLSELLPGQIVFCVLAREDTDRADNRITSSIGMAIPEDPTQHGYISEHHSRTENSLTSNQRVSFLAADMLATSMGLTLDSRTQVRQQGGDYCIEGKRIRTEAITADAMGTKNGSWTTAVTCAAFVL